ncbi:hypothetical protein AGMMS50212_13730 [Spirochaetia bacterium]|nr:hypothetical protein AGMMS50212_13730 [Spirochaetia bacterium]
MRLTNKKILKIGFWMTLLSALSFVSISCTDSDGVSDIGESDYTPPGKTMRQGVTRETRMQW